MKNQFALFCIAIFLHRIFAVNPSQLDNEHLHNKIPHDWLSLYEKYGGFSLETAITNGIRDKPLLQWLIQKDKEMYLDKPLEMLVDMDDLESLTFLLIDLQLCGKPYSISLRDNGELCSNAFQYAIQNNKVVVVDFFATKIYTESQLGFFESFAAEQGQLDVVKYFVETGVIADDPSDFEVLELPLDEAIDHNHFHVVDYLLQQPSTAITFNTLLTAARMRNIEIYEAVKSRYITSNYNTLSVKRLHIMNSDLLFAVLTGNTPKVKELLDQGAQFNYEIGYTQTCLTEAIDANVDIEIVNLLFLRGGLFNAASKEWPDFPNLQHSFFQTDTGIQFLGELVSYLPVHLIWPFLRSAVFEYTTFYSHDITYDLTPAVNFYNSLLKHSRLSGNVLIECFLKISIGIMKDDLKTLEDLYYQYPIKFVYLVNMQAHFLMRDSSFVDTAFRLRRFNIVLFLIKLGGTSSKGIFEHYQKVFRDLGFPETEDEKAAFTALVRSTRH